MADERKPLTADEAIKGLQQLEPSDSWLKFDSVDKVVGWPERTISVFYNSIQPEQCQRTRHQTHPSETQRNLEKLGVFFKSGHVAVTEPGKSQPFWGTQKTTEMGEPRLRQAKHGVEASAAVDGGVQESPTALDCDGSAATGEGEGLTGGRGGGSLGMAVSPEEEVMGAGDVDGAVRECGEEDGAASEAGSETLGVLSVREIGEGGASMPTPTTRPTGRPEAWR